MQIFEEKRLTELIDFDVDLGFGSGKPRIKWGDDSDELMLVWG